MSPKHFFIRLLMLCAIQAGLCFILIFFNHSIFNHIRFISVTILAMAVFCILLYGLAKRTARSPSTRLYIQFIMLAVFLKMILCVTLIAVYKANLSSPDYSYVWPFLIIYITSTIYEVIFLERIGREKQISPP
jgi:hypothetical protein